MPQLAPGDHFQFVAWCQNQNQFSANVFNFRCDAVTGISVSHTVVMDQIDGVLAPLYKAILPTGSRYHGATFQLLSPDRLDRQYTIANAGAGTLLGDALPTQVAGVLNLKTGIASRFAQGRLYFPPCGEGDNTLTATPSAAYKAGINAIGAALTGGLTIASGGDSCDVTWCIFSRESNILTPVTTVTPRPNWGTQRRRSSITRPDVAPF